MQTHAFKAKSSAAKATLNLINKILIIIIILNQYHLKQKPPAI
jgi:hypothetical protein